MRVVAPTPATERSMAREVSSIPAHYPPGSAASTAAYARRPADAAQQSPAAELPQEPRSMQPMPVSRHPARLLFSSKCCESAVVPVDIPVGRKINVMSNSRHR